MSSAVAPRDARGPVRQAVRGQGLPQAMTAGGQPRRLGIARQLLLAGVHGEGRGLPGAPGSGPAHSARPAAPRRPLPSMAGCGAACRERAAPAARRHHQPPGPIHGRVDAGAPPLDLRAGEGCGPGPPTSDDMTGLDGMARDPLGVATHVQHRRQGLEPAVEGRPRAAVRRRVLHPRVALAQSDRGQGPRHLRHDEVPSAGRTRARGRRARPARQVGPKPVDGGLADVVQGLSPVEALAGFDLRHGLVVWGPFGPVIEVGIAARDVEGAVPHERFDHGPARRRH